MRERGRERENERDSLTTERDKDRDREWWRYDDERFDICLDDLGLEFHEPRMSLWKG